EDGFPIRPSRKGRIENPSYGKPEEVAAGAGRLVLSSRIAMTPSRHGPPRTFPPMTPATLLDLFARTDPTHPAVVLPEDGSTTTRAGVGGQVEALAAALRGAGLRPGQAVAVVLPNGLESLACFLAVTRARLIAAPLNPAYKPEEFRFYLEDIGAVAVIAPPEAHPV